MPRFTVRRSPVFTWELVDNGRPVATAAKPELLTALAESIVASERAARRRKAFIAAARAAALDSFRNGEGRRAVTLAPVNA